MLISKFMSGHSLLVLVLRSLPCLEHTKYIIVFCNKAYCLAGLLTYNYYLIFTQTVSCMEI
jgi:hypothetical protein